MKEVTKHVKSLVNDLRWFGLDWQEGVSADENAGYGPYYQSKRLKLYQKYADQLSNVLITT
jgi:glutamyl/glutaminyl-tRNA synthetase